MSFEAVTEAAPVEVVLEEQEVESIDPPWEEWSSLLCFLSEPTKNIKRQLFEEGLYAPPSEELCTKYISHSDSSVFRHPYYKYPAVLDPGVEEALLHPPPVKEYPDDGQELYMAICLKMNEAPSTIFYKQLLEPHMNMSFYSISTMGWRPMALALEHNTIVKSIDFRNNFMSLDGCYHFGQMLLTNNTLTELNFYGCNMGPGGVKRLVANLPKNKTLSKLNLSKNNCTDEGVGYIADAIKNRSSLSHLVLSYNSLTSKTAALLAEAIEYNQMMRSLDLSWNSLTVPKHMEMLVAQLLENDNFVEIDLSWNSLSDRFSKALTSLLGVRNLKVLKLNNNNLGTPTINAMAEVINRTKSLVFLDLSNNPLTPADAKTLVKCLTRRTVKINTLLMDNVAVDDQFVTLLDKILELKFRANTVVTYGYVNHKIVVKPPDLRDLVLSRAMALCSKPKKKAVDVGVMILDLNEMLNGQPMPPKELNRYFKRYGASQLNDDLLDALGWAFPGPKTGKFITCSLSSMAEFVRRKWPDAQPTPKAPEPEPAPAAPPGKGKGDKGAKGKKK